VTIFPSFTSTPLLIFFRSLHKGEIDIFEGVNLNTANQYTAHTAAGCNISTTPSPDYNVSPNSATLGATYCGPSKKNIGCYYVDNRGGSYGAGLNDGGGAVLVMQWEIEGIRICGYTVRVLFALVSCLFFAILTVSISNRAICATIQGTFLADMYHGISSPVTPNLKRGRMTF